MKNFNLRIISAVCLSFLSIAAMAQTSEVSLTIEAQISGRSRLILRGNTAQWHHLEHQVPGSSNEGGVASVLDAGKPTLINSAAWYPAWPDEANKSTSGIDSPTGHLNCDCFSDIYRNATPLVPSGPFEVSVIGGNELIISFVFQAPSSSNYYTLIVEFSSASGEGSGHTKVELRSGIETDVHAVNISTAFLGTREDGIPIASATILTDAGDPVADAFIIATFSGSRNEVVSATTDGSGLANFRISGDPTFYVTLNFDIVSITQFLQRGVYDPDKNVPDNYFDADRVSDHAHPIPGELSGYEIIYDPVRNTKIGKGGSSGTGPREIYLTRSENDIKIDLLKLYYARPVNTQYSYKLEPSDNIWRPVQDRRHVFYSNLGSGDYTFRIRASDINGTLLEEKPPIRILIERAWWENRWIGQAAASLILIVLVISYRVRVRLLLKMERMRLRIASDLHDDVGSSLSAIALRSQMLFERDSENPVMKDDLARLSKITNETIENLRDIIWFVDPKHEQLEDLIQKMQNIAAEMLRDTAYVFRVPVQKRDTRLVMNFRRHVFLLFKEALNNVVRHSNATNVMISVDVEDGDLLLTVEDNGGGFDADMIKRGNGIKNMHHRAHLLGGEFRVDGTPDSGTILVFRVHMA